MTDHKRVARNRKVRTRVTTADLFERSIDDACKIARRHSRHGGLHSTAHDAALTLVRALRNLSTQTKE